MKNRTFEIYFPVGMPLLNSNGREHWTKRAHITSDIRMTARNLSGHIPKLDKVKLRWLYFPPDNRRRDTGNLYPSFKAGLDGLVDAGVLEDDNDKHVISIEMARGDHIVKGGQLVLEIWEIDKCGDSI